MSPSIAFLITTHGPAPVRILTVFLPFPVLFGLPVRSRRQKGEGKDEGADNEGQDGADARILNFERDPMKTSCIRQVHCLTDLQRHRIS
jgi:hypothetical protein